MKLEGLRKFLIDTKAKLVELSADREGYDLEQIEYLIRLVDYFITGQIEFTKHNFNIFLDEIVTTSVMQVETDLLKIVRPFSIMKGEIYEVSL